MKNTASAHWVGNFKQGKGTISTQSGALKHNPYGFNTRFEGAAGTNPEELIGAAHAGCFTMAFAAMLGEAGFVADAIDTTATVTLEQSGDGFTITAVHLDMSAHINGIDHGKFENIASKAKAGCPVSRLLNARITLDARLEN